MDPTLLNYFLQLMGQGGGMNPMLQTPVMAGAGRTDIAPLLDDTGLGAVTGGIDPALIEQAMRDEVDRQRRLYEAEQQYQRSEIYAGIPQAPNQAEYFEAIGKQGANMAGSFTSPDLASEFIRLSGLVEAGSLSPMQAAAQLQATPNTDWTKESVNLASVNDYYEQVEKTAQDFDTLEATYQAKFNAAAPLLQALGSQYDPQTGQWTDSWEPFNEQEAIRQYYEEAGVPNMAFMPAPSERFTPQYETTLSGTVEDLREQLERNLPKTPEVTPYSFGVDAQSAAQRARQLQQEHINRQLAVTQRERERSSKNVGDFLASLGLTPYNASLGSMLNFSVSDALN